MPTILIVDDEKLLLESIVKSLSEAGYSTYAAASGKAALTIYENNNLDLLLLDVKLPDIDGISILKRIREKDPELPIIIMTAYSGIRGAVEAIKSGAYDYVAKPFDVEELLHVIKRCLESQLAFTEIKKIRSVKKERFSFERILTNNSQMMSVIELCKRLANKTHSTVLILGESGTGKELIANAIHYNDSGHRSKGPFVAVNFAALSGGVMESELFGHEKGAFTGAIRQKKGLFEVADKGTIFFDEISEIDLKAQVKLLRFIEERTFQHVGGTRDIAVDVRIIAATNRDLIKEVKEGRFRED
jgi:DNA-binding NtrC family response regulator